MARPRKDANEAEYVVKNAIRVRSHWFANTDADTDCYLYENVGFNHQCVEAAEVLYREALIRANN